MDASPRLIPCICDVPGNKPFLIQILQTAKKRPMFVMERLWLCWAQIGPEVWSEGRRAAHTICWPFDRTRLGHWEQIQPGRRRMGLDVDFETLCTPVSSKRYGNKPAQKHTRIDKTIVPICTHQNTNIQMFPNSDTVQQKSNQLFTQYNLKV